LGSLPRSEPGGSILFRSYWLLYLLYLGPIAILGILVALTVLIGRYWRDLSEGIGYGLARKRRARKPRSRRSFIVAVLFWALAIVVLFAKGCTPFCKNDTTPTTIKAQIVGANGSAPDLSQIGNALPVLSNFVQTSWYSLAFLALLVASTVVIFQSVRVAMRESGNNNNGVFPGNPASLEAVHTAMKLVGDPSTDPRNRIMACYQHLVSVAMGMGASVSSDQTARELETGIRTMFGLERPAISHLTLLFEEARYSLHPITEDDSRSAYQDLQSIAEELKIQMTLPP
jgi:hypothetical protein